MEPYTVVGFFARDHGLNGMEALINSPKYRLKHVFTHRLLPKSEDPERRERPEFSRFAELAKRHNIPLDTVDSNADQERIAELLKQKEFDLIASISWRRLIPGSILSMAKIGAVNLHRGLLPNYPGAEPIKQALMHGDKDIIITAHEMTEVIDGGAPLSFFRLPIEKVPQETIEEKIARLKKELTPHFGPLLIEALDKIVVRNNTLT